MNLDVSPDHLFSASGQHLTTDAAVQSAVGAAKGVAAPIPAGIDPVSRLASKVFSSYQRPFFSSTADGMEKLRDGATVLPPTAVKYSAEDVIAGSMVTADGSTVLKI